MDSDEPWRFQYIEGDIRWATPEDGKRDADLIKEWLNEVGGDLGRDYLKERYFKVQFHDRGDAFAVDLLVPGNRATEEAGRSAFESWARDRGKSVNWTGASRT